MTTDLRRQLLYDLVDKMFDVISALNVSNQDNANTVQEMGEVTEQMSQSISSLQRRSSRAGLSTLKLNSLVSQFTVTDKSN